MTDKTPLRYIVLPVVAVLIAVLVIVMPKTGGTQQNDPISGTPTPTQAAGSVKAADPTLFSYETADDGSLTVLGFTEEIAEVIDAGNIPEGLQDGILVIPAESDGTAVKTVGESAFSDYTFFTELIVEDGITTIAYSAFSSCVKLESVSLPETLKTIEDSAFYGCTVLSAISFPKSIRTVEAYSFASCDSLTEATLPFTTGLSDIFNGTSLKKVTITDGNSIAEDAFFGFEELETVIIDCEITLINEYAFADCKALKNINIPESLLSLGANAFENCASLTSVILPEGLSVIGEFAFSNCTALEIANIPKNVVTIGQQAFGDCDKLTLKVVAGSAGEQYAINEDIPYELTE